MISPRRSSSRSSKNRRYTRTIRAPAAVVKNTKNVVEETDKGSDQICKDNTYFLYLVSDAFFKELTQLPELEFARDKIKVAPSQECVDRLLQATPYAIGTEFINEQWIREMFVQLEQVFQRQISSYQGSVAMYLAEKNQNLHVPERIFLHLKENGSR